MPLILAGAGFLAGIINVMAGGGSLLTISAMILCGMPATVANGSNRVAIMAQNLSATAGFRRQGWSNAGLSIKLGLCALPGSLLGAWYGAIIPNQWFKWCLAGVMVLILISNLVGALRGRSSEMTSTVEAVKDRPARPLLGYLSMVGIGFYGGFIQAGVGFLLMPALRLALGPGLVRVNMHKVLLVAIYTTGALGIFIWQDKIWWIPAICLAIGNGIGGWIGANLAIGKGDRLIRMIFNGALIALVIKLLFF